MPQETGAVTPSMALAAMAASTADPPRTRTAMAARVEASFSVATAKRAGRPAAPADDGGAAARTTVASGMAARAHEAPRARTVERKDHRGRHEGVIAVIVVTGRPAVGG